MTGLVHEGTLRPGERLPSVRRLHRTWGVSKSTVLEAYRLLEDRGVIEVRPQSGHYVRAAPALAPEPRQEETRPQPADPILDNLMVRITAVAGGSGLVRLGCGIPDRRHLPLPRLNRVMGRVARERVDAHDYAPSPGHPKLRRALAARLLDSGCSLSPDDLVVTTGCTEALDLCLRVLARPGNAVLVESPTYFGLLELLKAQGLRAIEVPSHPRTGVDVDAVAEALEQQPVAAMALSTNYTNPLGALVPVPSKRRLAALAAAHRVPLIEDDAYGDVGFDGRRPPSVKAFDDEGWVLTAGTLSKTLSPGLRVGWVAPGRFHAEIMRLKLVSSLGSTTIAQLTAAEFLQNGGYDRHLRQLRRAYRDHVRLMSEAVRASFPDGTRLSRPSGGQFLWVELPEPADTISMFEDHRIGAVPGFSPRLLPAVTLRSRNGVQLRITGRSDP